MSKTCLKCSHVNPEDPSDPMAACPACGAIYRKVEEFLARQSDPGAKPKPEPKPRKPEAPPRLPDPVLAPSDPATEARSSTAFSAGPSSPSSPINLEWFRERPWTKTVGIVVITFFVGFFCGREHMRQQVAKGFREAFAPIAALAGNPDESKSPEKVLLAPPKDTPITATMVSKRFRPQEASGGRFQSAAIEIVVRFKNAAAFDVRAFDGALSFTDLLGNVVLQAKVAVNEPVAKGAEHVWEGEIDYNQFLSQHKALRAADAQSLRVIFYPSKVLFADGTTKDFTQ